ncbi:MAG: KpsF/GutQ family sugar-phosphate isomerase [Prevotella sp.]|nr:KpsF/GutQ family sugar-phosphate isomerase [Prevotella sp.]
MSTREYGIQCLRDEAQALLALIPKIDDNFDRAVALMLGCTGKVIVTGVGKSGDVGRKIAGTLSSTGTPSFFVNPLDAYHGNLGVFTPHDVVLAISNSGQTDELLRLVPFLAHHKIPVVAMSGNPQSLLAKNATCHIYVGVEREACPLNLAPTSSTTATLAMGDALAVALMEERHFQPQDFAQFHPGGELGKRLLTTADDVMHREDLPVLTPGMKLGEAIMLVSRGKLGLGVAIDDERIAGIITDGDLRRAIERWQASFFDHTVDDIMTHTPKMVQPQTKISEIQRIMQQYKIHSVLVADESRRLLGVVDHYSCMV